jgi:hypothetical protein
MGQLLTREEGITWPSIYYDPFLAQCTHFCYLSCHCSTEFVALDFMCFCQMDPSICSVVNSKKPIWLLVSNFKAKVGDFPTGLLSTFVPLTDELLKVMKKHVGQRENKTWDLRKIHRRRAKEEKNGYSIYSYFYLPLNFFLWW